METGDGSAVTPRRRGGPEARRVRDAEFDRAYRNVYEQLARIAQRHTRDPQGVQDLLQTAAYRAFVRWQSGQPINNLEAYLTACVLSACMDLHRWSKRQRHALERLISSEVHHAESAHEKVLRDAESESVGAAFGQLDADCQRILRLRVLEGASVRDVATKLRIPEGTVKSRCSRCLDQLGRLMND